MITQVDITPRAFDSHLFSLDVKLLELTTGISISEAIEVIQKTAFDLLYIISSQPIETEFLQNKQVLEISYCDEKIVFSGAIENLISTDSTVPVIANTFKPEDFSVLENLAFQSGEFSRFYLDQKLPHEAFNTLYSTWISKSLSKEYADDYYIAYDGKAVGLLTSSIRAGVAQIGLLAVDKHSRGKGIGRNLLSRFATEMKGKNIEKVAIPTQRANIKACGFYQSLGLSEIEHKFIYHCWKNNG
ncbi:GNAT family N-acetyltransferase [Rheinheimera sp. UJ63]|uniref:GNAT family N-acetyltransferase n=1 Tax=Rheinheimera sp. UJ63 TaxID=2910157 RepID=UPI001F21D523|nr:GNAT family N-acetyltransferase [Rheinheimera sp. UJ63]MCF4007799.1 GNAT family N-acetyltransferase [Rheinheimera sp. UJ63]